MTKIQQDYLEAVKAAGGRDWWVTAEAIRSKLPDGRRGMTLWGVRVGLRRLARVMAGGEEQLISSTSRGYCLAFLGERHPQLESLTPFENDVVEAIVSFGVGHWVSSRKVEERMGGINLKGIMRRLPDRLDAVKHEFWMQSRQSTGVRLWPRGDARWEVFR